MPSDIERIRLVETFNNYPVDELYSVDVYIGKSFYADAAKKVVVEIPDNEVDDFFEKIKYITGYTRIPTKGKYNDLLEGSEMVRFFNIRLRTVLRFCYGYNARFQQECVYLDISQPTQFLVRGTDE